jgi:hypothetical protein
MGARDATDPGLRSKRWMKAGVIRLVDSSPLVTQGLTQAQARRHGEGVLKGMADAP